MPATTSTATRTSLRQLPAVCGWSFLAAGYFARLPQAMTPIGMLLLVSATTGRYAVAGIALACLGVGAAVGGLVVGVLADKYGHRAVGLLAAAGNVGALTAFVAVASSRPVLVALCALALAVGLTHPQTGALARSRWSRLARRRADGVGLIGTALAYEDVVDETSFVLGPTLAGLLSAALGPSAPLLTAAALCAFAQVTFALHRTAVPATPRRRDGATRDPLPWRTMACLLPVFCAFGMVFGSTQTGLAAVLGSQGQGALTGPVYAVLGLSSGVAALLTTMLPTRFSLHARMLTFAGILTVFAAPLPFADTPATFLVVLACAGLAIAPLGITCAALAERSAPPGRVATVLTALGTAGTGGVALGSSVGGQLADAFGGHTALVIPSLAGLLAVASALLARRMAPDRRPRQLRV